MSLISRKEKTFFLIGETQAARSAIPAELVHLSKNVDQHQLTTMGAGVPNFTSLSADFGKAHRTARLFVSEPQLDREGVVNYFGRGTDDDEQVRQLLTHVRRHNGGHVFSLMRTEKLLAPMITDHCRSAKDVISHYDSHSFRDFRDSEDFTTFVLQCAIPK